MTTDEERIARCEEAIIQINHFTEGVEALNLPDWKLSVQLWQADMKAQFKALNFWLKLMVAGAWVSPAVAMLLLKSLLDTGQ
jgi:hypothetical protein